MSDILSRLSRAWFGRPAPRASVRPSSRFTPRLEMLEARTVPAGTLTAVQSGTTLTITAVDDPTDVDILDTNNQDILIAGTGAGNFTVSGLDGEFFTFNGGAPVANFNANGVTNIKLVMKLGNDTVTVTNATLTGTLTFQGGSGNNSLFIDGANDFTGNGTGNNTLTNVSITNGDGADTFSIGGGNNDITGNLTITNGLGDSITDIGVLAADDTLIGGTVKVTNLAGDDQFFFSGTTAVVNGAITISNGNGDSNTRFQTSATSTVGGNLSITNLDGDDVFQTSGGAATATFASIKISNGSGRGGTDQNFNAQTNQINGSLSVTATAGDDDFSVDGTTFNVTGAVTIKTGSGGSTTSFSPGGNLDIDGAVSVTCGAGDDNLNFNAGGTVSLVSVKFSAGTGDSLLEFDGNANTTVTGTISSTHTDGFNDFLATPGGFFDVGGAITVSNGTGGSTTDFSPTGLLDLLGITITNGDGFDEVFLGGGADANTGSVKITNGAGGSDVQFLSDDFNVTGSVTVTNGNGFDNFGIFSNSTFDTSLGVKLSHGSGGSDTQLVPGLSADITTTLSITATDGNDRVEIAELAVGGATTINTGNGNDTVVIDNSLFTGKFSFLAGAGADLVQIEVNTTDGTDSAFDGGTDLNLGNGDDFVVIGDATDGATFAAAVKLAGGLDLDILLGLANLNNTGLPAAGPLPFLGFEQLI